MYIIWLCGHHDVGAIGTVDCNIAVRVANSRRRTVRISEDLSHGFVLFELLDGL